MKKLITTIGLLIAFGAAGSASALKVKVNPKTGKTKPSQPTTGTTNPYWMASPNPYCKPSECPGSVGSGVQADSAVPAPAAKPAVGKLGKLGGLAKGKLGGVAKGKLGGVAKGKLGGLAKGKLGGLGNYVPKVVGTIKKPVKATTKPTKVPTSDGNFGSKSGNL